MEELRYLFESPGLRIAYDKTNNWLFNQWRGPHDEITIQQGGMRVYACLAQQPCTRILSDHSELRGDWQKGDIRLSMRYFKRLAQQGVTHFAWVYGPEYHDRVAMERTWSQLTHPVVGLFDDVASAYEWLRRCPDLTQPASG